MIFVLLLFTLFHRLHGAPLDQMDGPSSSISPPLLPRSRVQFGTRTESDIIITCLATIFACTWTTMHPNIPSPVDSGWDILKRRIRWVFYALVAPELITTMAFRQRLAASAIVEQYNTEIVESSLPANEREAMEAQRKANQSATRWRSIWSLCIAVAAWLPAQIKRFFTRRDLPQKRKGRIEEWTTAHGFFAQMGGFMLSKDGRPLQTLSDTDEIIKLIQDSKVAEITTTEEDIQDRSKGDAISKGFVILQTTWFFMQIIARWSTGLVVTELEVVTLGFVVLNGLTYALWWDKPQNVNVPVYLEWIGNVAWKPKADTDLYKMNVFLMLVTEEEHIPKLPTSMKDIGAFLADVIALVLFVLPVSMIVELLSPVGQIVTTLYFGERPELRVSMFFSGDIDKKYRRFLTLSMVFIAVVFATVHLAPSWFLHFPSHRYTVLWRTCVIITAAVPPTIIPFKEWYDSIEEGKYMVEAPFGVILSPIALSYFSSRIALFVVSLVALRNIPSGALITIDWLSIFPHI